MSIHVDTCTCAVSSMLDMRGGKQSVNIRAPLEGHEQFPVLAGPWVSDIYHCRVIEGKGCDWRGSYWHEQQVFICGSLTWLVDSLLWATPRHVGSACGPSPYSPCGWTPDKQVGEGRPDLPEPGHCAWCLVGRLGGAVHFSCLIRVLCTLWGWGGCTEDGFMLPLCKKSPMYMCLCAFIFQLHPPSCTK